MKLILQDSLKVEGAASGCTALKDYNYSNKTDEHKSLSILQSIETAAGRQLRRKPKIISNDDRAATLAATLSNKKVNTCTVKDPLYAFIEEVYAQPHSPPACSLSPCVPASLLF